MLLPVCWINYCIALVKNKPSFPVYLLNCANDRSRLLLRALEGYLQSTDAAVLGISKNIGEAAKDAKLAIQSLDSKVDIESVAQDQWRKKDAARKQKEDDLRHGK